MLQEQLVYMRRVQAMGIVPCCLAEPLALLGGKVKDCERVVSRVGFVLACASGMEIFINQGTYEDFSTVVETVRNKILTDFIPGCTALPMELQKRFDAYASSKTKQSLKKVGKA